MQGNWNYPTPIRFGAGRVKEAGDACLELGMKKPLIVTDADLAELPPVALTRQALEGAGLGYELFARVRANPDGEVVSEGVEAYKAAGCDGVLALGGGSPLDAGKAIALMVGQTRPLFDFVDEGDNYKRVNTDGVAPIVAIPTTAGTGSEVTPIAIVTTGETTKAGVVSPVLQPDIALLDAELTIGLPPHVTATTGIDAMVHAIEAYTSVHRKNPLSDMLAREALRLLARNILTAVRIGSDVEARSNMLLGALLAGQAFANAPVAAVHALAYPLGGHFHIPHGLSNSLVLPHVMRFNAPSAKSLYAELAPIIMAEQFVAGSDEDVTDRLITWIETLIQKVSLPNRLRDCKVPEDFIGTLASDAMQQQRLLVNNPREVTEPDALAIYQAAW